VPEERIAAPAAQAPVVAPRSGWGRLLLGILAGGFLVSVLLVIIAVVALSGDGKSHSSSLSSFGRGKVAILPIEGEIVDSRQTIEDLQSFADNSSIKAIVVRINSPGGGVAPSQEINREILRVREESGKPVVASVDSVAASGGYYIAVACDPIIANPGSITGSIGVIAQWFNLEKLVEWAKVTPETFTSGSMKDMGSPYRPMTDVERAYYQKIIQQLHEQFVGAVIRGREGKMKAQDIRNLADGRVFTGQEASDLKLVDRLGGLEDAVRLAAERAGIKGTPAVVYPKHEKPGLLEVLADAKSQPAAIVSKILSGHGSPFLYRW
jgi:protease-4